MTDKAPVIWWVRRELRLHDNPVLQACLEAGRPVIPVFILDEVFEAYGACPLWRFGLGAETFAITLEAIGSKLIFRRGKALDVLRDVVRETGASGIRWGRAYDPEQVARDKKLKAALTTDGVDAASVSAHLLFEPWKVETKTGGFYKVYSPFWRAVKDTDVADPLPAPGSIPAPASWPATEVPSDWNLAVGMNRGACVTRKHLRLGEQAALARLHLFTDEKIDTYKARRDFPGEDATSGLSENLAWGEVSARTLWHAGHRAMEEGKNGAEHFVRQLVWRDFAYHLIWHTPHIVNENWREGWDAFPWNDDEDAPEVRAWKQGRTGVRFVDAAMREMYVTGRMHNRARMIVASYLTKHLMTHWKIGQRWFENCLTDWDPASNAMGWQWTAGSGPDAAPYFRVFNPVTQLDKFDANRAYDAAWIAEGKARPTDSALSYFDAIPRSWALSPDASYPQPIISLEAGRNRALEAYSNRDF